MANIRVLVYGTSWCPVTNGIKSYLDVLWVSYLYKDIEADPLAMETVGKLSQGQLFQPWVRIDGSWYLNPSKSELNEILTRRKII